MELNYHFKRICAIVPGDLKSLADLVLLTKSILDDNGKLLRGLDLAPDEEWELADDVLHMVEIMREQGEKDLSRLCNELIYMVVSICLERSGQSVWSRIVERLFRRGFAAVLEDSIVKYYYGDPESGGRAGLCSLQRLSGSEASLQLCCNVLRKVAKSLHVDLAGEEVLMWVDSNADIGVIRKVIALMFGSYLNLGGEWNYSALAGLFHPFSRTYLPCLVQYVVIDQLTEEPRVCLMEYLGSLYSDSELMRAVQVDRITYLAGSISRLMATTRLDQKRSSSMLSKCITKAVTAGLSTLNPTIRLATMTVAESYSIFLYNNGYIKGAASLLGFEKEIRIEKSDTLHLAAFKSDLIVNPNLSNTSEETFAEKNSVVKVERVGAREEEQNGNDSFIDFIFEGVPALGAKSIKGYVRETWLAPPQHILQCYERLLSRPARGDVDYECLSAHGLDRVEDESVANKILRVSQTLVYLPHIVAKNETMLEKYAVPLSTILLRLDDLDLYRDKIAEIARGMHTRPVLESWDSKGGSLRAIAEEPEPLILSTLVLITYHCPLPLAQFYSSHLFDTEYTLAIRITMLLCIQYTAMALNEGLGPEALVNKVLQDDSRISNTERSGLSLEVLGDRDGRKGVDGSTVSLVPNTRKDLERNGSLSVYSTHFVRNFNSKVVGFLLEALGASTRAGAGVSGMEEDVAVGILETLIILATAEGTEARRISELKEMVSYFPSATGGQRLRSTMEIFKSLLATHTSQLWG